MHFYDTSAGAQMQKDLTVERTAETMARREEYRIERVLTEQGEQEVRSDFLGRASHPLLMDDYYEQAMQE